LVSGIVVLFAYEYSCGGSNSDTASLSEANTGPCKIGVVSILRIFQDCKKNADYREEATKEQDDIMAGLEKLSKEIDAEKAGLKTLKAGSSDYLDLMKGVLEKQARLQAEQEFYKQQMAMKDQQWTEELYKDILQETIAVAKQKGLGLVLEKDEPILPAVSGNELMLTIRTHKLLYSGGCLDITSEVIARLDAKDGETRKMQGTKP
jgi:Skp family chaperone for outer membrane proteins